VGGILGEQVVDDGTEYGLGEEWDALVDGNPIGGGSVRPGRAPVVIVTGANCGIGLVTAGALADRGATVILACRSEAKANQAINEIRSRYPGATKLQFLPLELGDLRSVVAFVGRFQALGLPLHTLILNAGVTGALEKTAQGVDGCFGVNHFGHFVLTNLLLNTLRKTSQSSPHPSRVVVVSSTSHRHTKRVRLDKLWTSDPSLHGNPLRDYDVYAQSKLSNNLFTAELHRRFGSEIDVFSLHPGGFIATGIIRGTSTFDKTAWWFIQMLRLITRTVDQGAATTVYCATAPSLTRKGGGYYHSCKFERPSRESEDPAAAKELWEQSEQYMRKFLPHGSATFLSAE